MKTLVIRDGDRLAIRAIAREAADGGRDRCPTLQFFQENMETMAGLGALLSDTAENGPRHGDGKFKKLSGTDELYEFKSNDLRLLCFWDDGSLIICTHGFIKRTQKAPKSEIERGEKMKREYFDAKANGTLIHAQPKR
jgi:mRNA-degrading endonuclease RelE of RelBE toxin-antitoxin system